MSELRALLDNFLLKDYHVKNVSILCILLHSFVSSVSIRECTCMYVYIKQNRVSIIFRVHLFALTAWIVKLQREIRQNGHLKGDIDGTKAKKGKKKKNKNKKETAD